MPNESRQHVHIYCPTINPSSLRESLPGDVPLRVAPPDAATVVQASRFEMPFEEAFERLELLPRMFIELDGSFVWSGQHDAVRWQIDGMLYDRDGRLQRVELTGQAPRHTWEQLLNVFGQPFDTITIHCLHQQRFIRPAEFLDREF